MELFCFASESLKNIRLGYSASCWAVAGVSSSAMSGRVTKAKKYLTLGSKGLLYCNELQSFTVPFITESNADASRVETSIWPGETWHLPFAIRPLGNPSKTVSAYAAKRRWQFLQKRLHERPGLSVPALMNFTGATAFVPINISDEDWAAILADLGGEFKNAA